MRADYSPLGIVTHIFVASARGAAANSVASVEAMAGEGLRGDRYAEAKNRRAPDYEVTLIELEHIEAFAQETGLPLTPEMPRRNIVTRGVRLNDLCGRRFSVGGALFEGLELCEPCGLFAKRTHREVLKFFVGKGGLRARILATGEVRVGDFVREGSVAAAQTDLGFTYRATAQGVVHISRAGRAVVTLRDQAAAKFLAKAQGASSDAMQQLCARVTGNYKRGNESLARTVRRGKGRDA